MSDHAALAVLHYYFPSSHSVRSVESIGNAGGWSGSQLWRVCAVANAHRGVPGVADNCDLCLRRWPREHPTPDRLRFIHATLDRAFSSGLQFVPAPLRTAGGQSFLEHGGRLWELTPWLPGAADYHSRPSRTRLRAAFHALARFHQATVEVHLTCPAPTFAERLRRLAELRDLLDPMTRIVHCGLISALDGRAARILTLATPHLAALASPLEFAARQRLALEAAIRDIHHDHVLFTGEEVTGLIDFEAMRVDTPLTDVARLVGSLAGDDRPARDFALAAYSELLPLTEADRRLIDLLDYSGLVLGGLNWLVWLYLERRDMGETGPIVKRLDEIISRLANSGRLGSAFSFPDVKLRDSGIRFGCG